MANEILTLTELKKRVGKENKVFAEYAYKQGESFILNTLSEEISKMANKYKEKLLSAECRDICTESRWSELNTILAMITGFKNSL